MCAGEPTTSDESQSNQGARRGFWIGALVAVALAAWLEFSQLRGGKKDITGVSDWFAQMTLDSSPFLVLFAILPIFWFPKSHVLANLSGMRQRWKLWFGEATQPNGNASDVPAKLRALILAVLVGAVSVLCSWSISQKMIDSRQGIRFGELPPAYHDEFSYLLQAKSFLAGRLSFPSAQVMPEIFEQTHVVNEGRYASRYFPATGAWIAPFLQIGHPYWGHWLAGALSAAFIFAAGRELGGNGVGFLAGLLTALSPGMSVFSNLLLAHHPTMLGLSLFLCAFLRMLRTAHWLPTVAAGIGLTFAMLARPMTAAGFGLPFGVWFVVWLIRCRRREDGRIPWPFRLSRLAAMGGPILVGFAFLGYFNNAITGDSLLTPYDVFTETYTPRHAYGFNNVVRAEERIAYGTALTKTTFENYDRWAVNLTPMVATRNVLARLLASLRDTLAIVPLLLAAFVFLSNAHRENPRWWLILAAIVSLHLAHVPYWFDGIAHWHYVFESGPLLLLLFARASQLLFRAWNSSGRGWMPVWWFGLIVVSLSTAYFSNTPFWPEGRIDQRVRQIAFSRWKYRQFHQLIDNRVHDPKALILIEHDPADRHIDYVSNEPNLQGDQQFLYGRFIPERMKLSEIVKAFPDRACYLYRVRERRLVRVSPP